MKKNAKPYLAFSKGETLSHFLSWSRYMLILKVADGLEIEFYCRECERSHWSVRELRWQLNSMLFHRLALSKDKKGVLESRYQLYLPDKEQLRRELAYAIEAEEGRHGRRKLAEVRKGGGQ